MCRINSTLYFITIPIQYSKKKTLNDGITDKGMYNHRRATTEALLLKLHLTTD